MSVKVKKRYATFFKRSSAEKKQAEMSKDLESAKEEIEELKSMVESLMKSNKEDKKVSSIRRKKAE